MLFDTHAHLLSDAFDEDRIEIIETLRAQGILGYVECGTDQNDSMRAAALAREYAEVYAAVGVHPHEASSYDTVTEHILADLLTERHVVAIGEIGLDYHYDFSPRDRQREVFRAQMELARKTGFPVVIHTREAWQDTMDILRSFPDVHGVLHCYSGSAESVSELLDMGYYIAFGGAITFKNAKKPLAALKAVPLDRLLLETDSPYMTPEPHRGQRNSPVCVKLVAQKAAEVREEDLTVIAKATTDNAKRIFRIKDL